MEKKNKQELLAVNLDGPRSKTLKGTYIYAYHVIQTQSQCLGG